MKSPLGPDEHYEQNFIPAAHRLGKRTLFLAIILSLLPALYLSFVLGAFPGVDVVFKAFLAIVAFVGVAWLIEPVSYFPMLGISGSYMSFLSGNIGNMRLPVVISSQAAIDAETGSRKAEIAAILGIAVSVVVNLVFVLLLILLGDAIVSSMPPPVAEALKQYTFPALYGAVFVMFFGAAKEPRYPVYAVILATIVLMLPISEIFNVTAAGVTGIILSLVLTRLPKKQDHP